MLIASITMTTKSAQAQCPTGYTSHIIHNVNINFCLYDVELCVKCPTGPVPGFAEVKNITKLDIACSQTLNMQELIDAIEAMFCNWDYISTTICPDLQGPNCPAQGLPYRIAHALCWQAEVILDYGGNPVVWYHSCASSAICIEEFTVCFNGTEYIKTYTAPLHVDFGPPSCSLEAWQVPEPTLVGQITPCFLIHTICNP